MVCMLERETLERVLELVRRDSPRPTELLKALESQMSYSDLQDAISELLDSGEVVLDSERRLRIKSNAA
jgi:hypothetical protein